jgi:thiol-disulfide isomerase/thioredoxin
MEVEVVARKRGGAGRWIGALLVCLLWQVEGAAQGARPSLQTLDGRAVPWEELQGKLVVLSFGGTWIPQLERELTVLQRVASRYDAREVAVFWVSINPQQPGARHAATTEELREFLRRRNVRLPVLRDPAMATYRAFDLSGIPTILLLDREGRVAHRLVGIGTEPGDLYNDLVQEIERHRK